VNVERVLDLGAKPDCGRGGCSCAERRGRLFDLGVGEVRIVEVPAEGEKTAMSSVSREACPAADPRPRAA